MVAVVVVPRQDLHGGDHGRHGGRRRRRGGQVRRGFALVLVGVEAGAQGLTQVEVGDGARRHPRAPDRSEEEQDEAEEQRGPRRVDELAGALGRLLGGLGLVRGRRGRGGHRGRGRDRGQDLGGLLSGGSGHGLLVDRAHARDLVGRGRVGERLGVGEVRVVGLALALVAAGGGHGRRGSEGERGRGNLGGVHAVLGALGQRLDAELGQGLGDLLGLGGRRGVGLLGLVRGLGDGIEGGAGQGLDEGRVLDGGLRRGAKRRHLGGRRDRGRGNRRNGGGVLGGGGGDLRGCGDRRIRDDLVERGQFRLVAGRFWRGSHRILRVIGCVFRHYRSLGGSRRGGRRQDVHHRGGDTQARQEGAHHGRGLAGRGEAQDQQVHEAGDRRDDRELNAGQGHAAVKTILLPFLTITKKDLESDSLRATPSLFIY